VIHVMRGIIRNIAEKPLLKRNLLRIKSGISKMPDETYPPFFDFEVTLISGILKDMRAFRSPF